MSEKLNSQGRSYVSGKPMGNDMRMAIVDKLKESGANVETRYVPKGELAQTSKYFKVSKSHVKNIWERYCESGNVDPLPHTTNRQTIFDDQDLEYIAALKKERPSITTKELKQKLLENSGKDVCLATINNAVRKRLNEGNWSYKVLSTPAAERFSDYNIAYTNAYLAEIQNKNPYQLKFMDEAGFAMYAAVHRKRGHAPVGIRGFEAQTAKQEPNTTLNLLLGLDGTVCADFVFGASNTAEYLRFFHEAATSFSDEGNPYIKPGDTIIVDNASIHRFDAERVLRTYFETIDVEYIFLPTYSPDMNPVEHAFNFIRTQLRSNLYTQMARENMPCAILHILNGLTTANITGFFKNVGYIQF